VQSFREPGFGVIVRTEAEGRGAAELRQDYMILTETWREIQTKAKSTPAPALIHQDMGLVYKILRDAFGSDIGRLIIDSPTDYAKAHEIIARLSPDLQDRIELYDGAKGIFEHFKIEEDIDRLLRRKVPLKSDRGTGFHRRQLREIYRIDRPGRHNPQDKSGSHRRDCTPASPA